MAKYNPAPTLQSIGLVKKKEKAGASNALVLQDLRKKTTSTNEVKNNQNARNQNEIVQTGLSRDERVGANSLAHRISEREKKRANIARIKAGSGEAEYRKNTIADSARIGISETFGGANNNGKETDFDRAYNAGGLRAVDDQVAQGKIQPRFGESQNGQINYRRGADVTLDERDYFQAKISELETRNRATEKRREEESKNYKASTARIEAKNRTSFDEMGKKLSEIENNNNFENSYRDENNNFITTAENSSVIQENFVPGTNNFALTGQSFSNSLYGMQKIDKQLSRELGKSSLIQEKKEQLENYGFALNNANLQNEIQFLQKQVQDVNDNEERYASFFAMVEKNETDKAERKKERNLSEIALEKQQILAEKEATMEQMGQKRSRLEGFLKAKYANYGMLNSSYGLNSLSRQIGAFESQIANVELGYNNELRNLQKASLQILDEYDDSVSDSFLKYQKNILENSIEAEKKRNNFAFQAFEAKKDKDVRDLGMMNDILGGLEKAENEWKKEQKEAEEKAEKRLFDEAKKLSDNTGIIYTVKNGEIKPILRENGKPLLDWRKQQEKQKYLMSFADIPARKENFDRYITESKIALQTAFESGFINENEMKGMIEKIGKIEKDEIYQVKKIEIEKEVIKNFYSPNSYEYKKGVVQTANNDEIYFSDSYVDRKYGKQCAGWVNDKIGQHLGSLYHQKQKLTTSKTPIVGGFFVQKTGGKYGHTGLVEKVFNENGEQKMRIAHYNYGDQEKFRRETLTFKNGKWRGEKGDIRNITGYGEGTKKVLPREKVIEKADNISIYALEKKLDPIDFKKKIVTLYPKKEQPQKMSEYIEMYMSRERIAERNLEELANLPLPEKNKKKERGKNEKIYSDIESFLFGD